MPLTRQGYDSPSGIRGSQGYQYPEYYNDASKAKAEAEHPEPAWSPVRTGQKMLSWWLDTATNNFLREANSYGKQAEKSTYQYRDQHPEEFGDIEFWTDDNGDLRITPKVPGGRQRDPDSATASLDYNPEEDARRSTASLDYNPEEDARRSGDASGQIASGDTGASSRYFTPGHLGDVTVAQANKFMSDSWDALSGEGGKYHRKYSGLFDMLQSGEYDPWKDWATYGDNQELAARLFWQTYAPEYSDLIAQDFDTFYNGGDWWNDETMRQIFDSELEANRESYNDLFSNVTPENLMGLISSPGYFADDAADLMLAYGLNDVWEKAGYDASKDGLFRTWFYNQDWSDETKSQDAYEKAADAALRIIYNPEVYGGVNVDNDAWASVADTVYGRPFSSQYDNNWDAWYNDAPNGTEASDGSSITDLDIKLGNYTIEQILGLMGTGVV